MVISRPITMKPIAINPGRVTAKQQTIQWTALPNGRASKSSGGTPGRLRLSVFVSPRLQAEKGVAETTLDQYPDVLNWTTVAESLIFSVQFQGGPAVAATRVGPAREPALWAALFKNSTFVRPYEFTPLDDKLIYSYPVRHVMSFLQGQYSAVGAAAPVNHPPAQAVIHPQLFGPIASLRVAPSMAPPVSSSAMDAAAHVDMGSAMKVRRDLHSTMMQYHAVPPTAQMQPASDFAQVDLFHEPRNRAIVDPRTGLVSYARATIAVPKVDFHQMITSLGQYPEVLRRLGLVIDLEFDALAGIPASGTVSVVPKWTPGMAQTVNSMPLTRYNLDAGRFAAAPKNQDPDVDGGLLRLDDTDKFDVLEVDPDSSAIKAMQFADTVTQHVTLMAVSPSGAALPGVAAPVGAAAPGTAAMPSLRSGGISVARSGRAYHLVQMFTMAHKNNDDMEASKDVILSAEDVLRGYRIDVWDSDSQKWHSLCMRHGTYQFLDASITREYDDEGWISTAATKAADGSSPDLAVHEVLFRWTGWSLSAPRPGQVVKPDDSHGDVQNQVPPDVEFKFQTSFSASTGAAKGSLPRLRFGTDYRLRARAVDLAGNSLTLDEAPDAHTTAALHYQRFEPAVSPAVVLHDPTTEGESVERLVIRSNYNTPATKDCQRHIVPPAAAELQAETHRQFDGAGGLQKSAYATIAAKEGSFNAGSDGKQAPHTVDQLTVPYLADPIARGAALRNLPGVTSAGTIASGIDKDSVPTTNPQEYVVKVPYAGAWPDPQPFRLQITEGSGEPTWDAGARMLTVPLPKAEVAHVRLSSFIDPEDLNLMGIWNWVQQYHLAAMAQESGPMAMAPPIMDVAPRPGAGRVRAPVRPGPIASRPIGVAPIAFLPKPPPLPDLRLLALQGTHWMVTPSRDIVLVHAVQRPLIAPAFSSLTATRGLGQTSAELLDRFPISGKSTAKLDIQAQWTEPVDALAKPKWETISGQAHAFEIRLNPPETEVDLRGHRHEFYDTKYRKVSYQAIATTRFPEYFPAGTTPLTRESDWTAIDIPNAARPAAPQILYVVPTFGWDRKTSSSGVVSKRTGGLRIYMERSWYSSGDGELLGVICLQPPGMVRAGGIVFKGLSQGVRPMRSNESDPAPRMRMRPAGRVPPMISHGPIMHIPGPVGKPILVPDNLKPFVTQWGLDPIWLSPPTAPSATPDSFPKAVAKGYFLTLDELPNAVVSVAGHAVGYDEDRELWYCDIEVDAGDSYYPFVRLALARYQPISVENAHLSRVMLADFIQLAPDRNAAVTFDGSNPALVNISVSGVGYTGSRAAKNSEMEVSVETKNANVPDLDLGWTPADNGTFPLTAAEQFGGTGITWSGQVTLPGPRGQNSYRLTIKEYERFIADGTLASKTPMIAAFPNTYRRLVYAESLLL